MTTDLILPRELMCEIALRCDSKTILILRELYPDIVTDGFFIDYLIYNGYDVHVECVKFRRSCRYYYIKWTKNRVKHNEFGPALIYADGDKEWCIDGLWHNENGPAMINTDGDKKWFINGILHNENGPAVIYSNSYKVWYVNGLRHNEIGPAIIYKDGYKVWYVNGLLHNENGPARICKDGRQEWWINNQQLSEYEFNNRRR